MKKLIFSSLFLVFIGIVFLACTKESINQEQKKNELGQTFNEKGIVVGFYFTWDEWGRKSKNCHRAGLCNFRLEKIEIQIKSVPAKYAPVQSDGSGNLYVEILADKDLEFDDSAHNLFIDEDIYSTGPDGKIYRLPKGIYPLISDLGDLGGYKLPLYKI